MHSPVIPFELSDYVIDYLHDDRRALKACSLVCRAFRPAAYFHLFHTVDFPSPAAGKTFWHLLRHAPGLGAHARSAHFARITSPNDTGRSTRHPLRWSIINNVSNAADDDAPADATALWSAVFAALPKLEQAEFLFLDLAAASLRAHIAHAFPRLTELTLQYCRFPTFGDFVALVLALPRLARLTLRGVSWEDVETMLPRRARRIALEGAPLLQHHGGMPTEMGMGAGTDGEMEVAMAMDAQGPRLVALHLGRDLDLATLVPWLLDEDLCTGLQSLAVCSASQRDAVILGDVLRVAGPSLHELSLDWYAENYNDVAFPPQFSLSNCASLATLQLCCPVRLNGTLSWVPTALAQLPNTARARLSSLAFEIRLLGNLDAIDWPLVDRILAAEGGDKQEEGLQQECFTALETVRFRIRTWHTALQRGSEACSTLFRRLPGLSARGLIEICD